MASPPLVHRDAHELRAREREHPPSRAVPEGLDHHDIPRRQQRARHEIERHLRAPRDEHVVRVRGHAARRRQHRRQRRTQPRVPAGIAVAESRPPRRPQRPAVGAPEGVDGDEAEIRLPAPHRHEPLVGRVGSPRGARFEVEPCAAGHLHPCRRRAGEGPRGAIGEIPRHERPPRRLGRDPSLGRQLAVGGERGVPVDAQRARQLTAPRQPRPRLQPSTAHLVRDGARDAEERRQARGRVGEDECARPGGHRTGLAHFG